MAISLEELTANANFTRNVKGKVTLLPDPPRGGAALFDDLVRRPHRRAARTRSKAASRRSSPIAHRASSTSTVSSRGSSTAR